MYTCLRGILCLYMFKRDLVFIHVKEGSCVYTCFRGILCFYMFQMDLVFLHV